MKRIFKYFIQGLLILAPIAVTIYLVVQLFLLLDSFNPLDVPGLGIIFTFVLVTGAGFVANHFVSERLRNWGDQLLQRMPLLGMVYTAVKDLMGAFVGPKKSFKNPVLVRLYEQSEIRRLGFLTDEEVDWLPDSELANRLVTVYCPHSYNISGNLYLVPASYVTKLPYASGEVMKYAMSGGVTSLTTPSGNQEAESSTKPRS